MTRPRLRRGLRLRLARYGLDFRKGLHPTPSPPKSQEPLPLLILLQYPKYLGSYHGTKVFDFGGIRLGGRHYHHMDLSSATSALRTESNILAATRELSEGRCGLDIDLYTVE